MPKNDFDIDFDFEKEFDFDPKAFLDAEEYDDKADLTEFTDEELGLSGANDQAAAEDADLDFGDLDLDNDPDFGEILTRKNSRSDEPTLVVPSFAINEALGNRSEYVATDDLVDDMDFGSDDFAAPDFSDDPDLQEPVRYDGYPEDEPNVPDFQEDAEPPKTRRSRGSRSKEGKSFTLPTLAVPNIFTKFYALYFAPVLNKNAAEEPVDPDAPRRRRKKSKVQIFKEVYLPPILVCLCVVLILAFVIGSISNAIDRKRENDALLQSQQQQASDEASQLEAEYNRVMADAATLAANYDYEGAIKMLDSFSGDMTAYQDMVARRSEYINAMSQLVEHKDPSLIPNLSFHVLIADPDRAFADEELGGSYNRNFVTTEEFTKILNNLYTNGYVLVDFDSFVDVSTGVDGQTHYLTKPITLPADKKPVMITETLVNYFGYMVDSNGDGVADAGGDGFASRLIVDTNGDIKAEYVDVNSTTHVGNYDLVPILEDFIKEHPEFSYRGARATLAVTGSEGIFGYRINSAYIASNGQAYYDEQVAGAKEVVQALRDKGYRIACFTYDNVAYGQLSANQITADLQEWTAQITPVLGNVDTLVYARTSDIQDYSGPVFNVLYTSGFRYFVSNGTAPWAEVKDTYVHQDRLMVTGNSMAWYSNQFSGMFDCAAILDVQRRGNVPN